MLVFGLIQSTLNSSSRELLFGWTVSIVNRYIISVIEASLGRIRLFLFGIFNSVSLTQSFKLPSQLPKRYLNKILIIGFSKINILFNAWVVANYQFAYLVFQAMIDYCSCGLVQVVSDTVTTPLIQSCLFVGKRFNILLVCFRLELCIAFVVPLINAFKSFSINQKLMPISIDTSTQIVNSQIYRYCFIRIDRCFYFLVHIDVFDFKPSSRVFGSGRECVLVVAGDDLRVRAASYLLNLFIFKSFWQLDFNLSIFLSKLARHGDCKVSVTKSNSRNNQRKITFFGQVSRQLWFLVTTSNRYSFKQTQERPHASIHHFHSLLSDIGIKQLIILIRFTDMVVRFISQTFSFSKEILPALIQRHIKKTRNALARKHLNSIQVNGRVFAQTSQCSQRIKFLTAKSSELIFLSGVHSNLIHCKNII